MRNNKNKHSDSGGVSCSACNAFMEKSSYEV